MQQDWSLNTIHYQQKNGNRFNGMGIHYDYKSTRGDKKLKKEAKRDAKRRNKKSKNPTTQQQQEPETYIPPIDKPITMDDLLMAQLEKEERDEKKKK